MVKRRVLLVMAALSASLAIQAAGPGGTPAAACDGVSTSASGVEAPSSMDYLVLASLADSSNIVAMSAYTKH